MNTNIFGKMLATVVVIAIITMAIPGVYATAVWTTTTLNFNIEAVDNLRVTVLGQTYTEASSSGNATSANIEFNTSVESTAWVNATVVGGSAQSDGSGIFNIDNVGTTTFNLTTNIDAALGTCTGTGGDQMNLVYNTSWVDTGEVSYGNNVTEVGVGEAGRNVLDSAFTPGDAAIELYLWANFTGCLDSDDDTATFYINGSR